MSAGMPSSSIVVTARPRELVAQHVHQRGVRDAAARGHDPPDSVVAAGVSNRSRRQRGDGGDEVVIGDLGLTRPAREHVGQVEQLLARRLRRWEAVVGLVQQPVEELRVDVARAVPSLRRGRTARRLR